MDDSADLRPVSTETGSANSLTAEEGAMKKLLAIAATAELLTGTALLIWPSLVIRLLLSAEICGAAVVVSRVAGTSLIALGLACWPSRANDRALAGILTYSLVVAVYLMYLGIDDKWVGILLWPAVVVHLGISGLLGATWLKCRKATDRTE